MTSPQFARSLTVEQILADRNHGHITVRYKVHGYWSSDSINLYIRRGWTGDHSWEFSISHSSGGRDDKEIKEDYEAVKNFSAALLDASELAKYLQVNSEMLEVAYQNYVEDMRKQDQEQELLRQKAIDEDPAMGMTEAEVEVDNLAIRARASGFSKMKVKIRGSDVWIPISAQCRERISFSCVNRFGTAVRMNKKQLIEMVAGLSKQIDYV